MKHADQAPGDLPDLTACRAADSLLALAPPAPAEADDVDDIRSQLIDVATFNRLGQHARALTLARQLVRRTDSLTYVPIQAEARYHLGRVATHLGTPAEAEEGEEALRNSRDLAMGSRHDQLVADVWLEPLRHAYHHDSSTERAREWSALASAWIVRLDNPPAARGRMLRQQGLLAFKDGRFADAEQHFRTALSVMDLSDDELGYLRALTAQDLGNALLRQNDKLDEARDVHEQALADIEFAVGRAHPRALESRFDLAMAESARGQLLRAQALLDEVLSGHRAALGDDHPMLGKAHLARAEIARELGHTDEARTHMERGLSIYKRAYGDRHHIKLAGAFIAEAVAKFTAGQFSGALRGYRRALAIQTASLPPGHVLIAATRVNIAEALVQLKEYAEALRNLDAIQGSDGSQGTPEIQALRASVRGQALLGLGERAAAEIVLRAALAHFANVPPERMTTERAAAEKALARALE